MKPTPKTRTQRKQIAHTLRMGLASYRLYCVNDDSPAPLLTELAQLFNQLIGLECGSINPDGSKRTVL